jgi:hypothetical protein
MYDVAEEAKGQPLKDSGYRLFSWLSSNAYCVVVIGISLLTLHLRGDDLFKIPENAAKELPPGVPRTVDTNGNVVSIDGTFTTKAYQKEALRLLIEEANKVARDLQLPETLPITETNLTHAYIGPFGFNYQLRSVGNITTSKYWYVVKRDYKFSDLTVVNIDDRCREYASHYQWPLRKLDTNAPYQLAIQWLSAAHMDVQGLNQDDRVSVALDPYWNGVKMGELSKRRFTPIYIVSWLPRDKTAHPLRAVASVEMFLPTKTLLDLDVENSKYILRPPLVFTNLAVLFPGTAKVTTNFPSKPIVIDGSQE